MMNKSERNDLQAIRDAVDCLLDREHLPTPNYVHPSLSDLLQWTSKNVHWVESKAPTESGYVVMLFDRGDAYRFSKARGIPEALRMAHSKAWWEDNRPNG